MSSEAGEFPIYGDESIMSKKAHGTCANAPADVLRWGCDAKTCDRVCCFNRHYAEHSGYFSGTQFVEFARAAEARGELPISFYDPIDGKVLFRAPVGRTVDAFIEESEAHGWPSFRDAEVEWANVRCLPGGEAVSLAGTHLGHNLPDRKGNRYCINLVSVCGMPPS